jgi:hypothetical protein
MAKTNPTILCMQANKCVKQAPQMAPRDIRRTNNPKFFGTHCLQHLFNLNSGRSISNPSKQANQKFQGWSEKVAYLRWWNTCLPAWLLRKRSVVIREEEMGGWPAWLVRKEEGVSSGDESQTVGRADGRRKKGEGGKENSRKLL